ncbi:MAG: hypothetical protein JSR38_07205 [Proteobacteria bacterium]|nr:hypothetical protein [Pseudomonadota bacterium]
MIDRIFSAVLTFCLLAGGTAAIGSTLFEHKPAAPAAAAQNVACAEPGAHQVQ